MVSEEMSFENISGQTPDVGWTLDAGRTQARRRMMDNGRRAITIAHPKLCSGELKMAALKKLLQGESVLA